MAGSFSEPGPRRVLVTGASGFVGAALVETLLEEGADVAVITRERSRLAGFPWTARTEVHEADITDPPTLAAPCRGADLVVHCAGYAHADDTVGKQDKINREGTENILRAAMEADVPRFIHISSSKVDSLRPGAYGMAKRRAEACVLAAHGSGKILSACLRPPAVYGPGMKGSVAAWITLTARGLAPPLPRSAVRIPMVHVEDLARAIVLAARSEAVWGRALWVSDGRVYRLKEMESAIREALGRRPYRLAPPRALFLGAAWTGVVLQRLGLPVGFSRSSYNILFSDEFRDGAAFASATGFVPNLSFYQALPAIIKQLTGRS